jgi:hypothetical protein
MDILSNRHYVYVLATTDAAKMNHSDLLVYSGPKKLDHDFRSKSW